jgi:hypothetical protein
MGDLQRPFLIASSSLPSSRKTRFSSQPLDCAVNFPLGPFEEDVALVGLEDDLPLASFARFGLFRSYKPFSCTMLASAGQNMATSAERMRALRERRRRGLRRLTIEVSEDDLCAIAKRGYEGAVTTNHDQQAQALGLFLSDALLQI